MGSTKAKQKPSTKPKKASNSQNGKKSRNGTNCNVESFADEFNPIKEAESNLRLLNFGELATKIVISYHYLGSAPLNAIKNSDHFQQAYSDSALKLIKRGILNKNGHIYNLTEEGKSLANDFIGHFRKYDSPRLIA